MEVYLSILLLTKKSIFHEHGREDGQVPLILAYKEYLEQILDADNVQSIIINNFPYGNNSEGLAKRVISLAREAKKADLADNIWTAHTTRDSTFGSLRPGGIPRSDLHLPDYLKLACKTILGIIVLLKDYKDMDPGSPEYELAGILLMQLYNKTIEELEREIKRTDIELSNKPVPEKIKELVILLPKEPRFNIVRDRYNSLSRGSVTPEQQMLLEAHKEKLGHLLEFLKNFKLKS